MIFAKTIVIEAIDIQKRFGSVHAVRGVRFTADKGEAVGLLGPNGAGKTTTIRMITGFLPPDAGQVLIDGMDTLNDSLAARRLIGCLPESTPLYPEMTVTSLLDHRAKLYRLNRKDRKAAIAKVIERCWLSKVSHRRVGHLSKGYRQRVGLAAALVHDPPALLLDEPTNGLDPEQISQMRTLVRELAVDHTVILSSHILSEVEKTCDRVIVISDGLVRADAPVREFADRAGRSGGCIAVVKSDDKTSLDSFRQLLAALPSAQTVNDEAIPSEPHWRRFTISPKAGSTDLAAQVGAAASNARVTLRELRSEARSLESVFLELISQTQREQS